jgi:hypothetical protein
MQAERALPSETPTLQESRTSSVQGDASDNEKQVAYLPPTIPDGGLVAWTTVSGAQAGGISVTELDRFFPGRWSVSTIETLHLWQLLDLNADV